MNQPYRSGVTLNQANVLAYAIPARTPNIIITVLKAIAALRTLSSEDDYRALADRYAIRRTHKQFWAYSDALQDANLQLAPVEAGLFDYNRMENR